MLDNTTFNRQASLLMLQLQEIANNLKIDIATLFQLIQEGRGLGLSLDASSVDGQVLQSSLPQSDYIPIVKDNQLEMGYINRTIKSGIFFPIPQTHLDPYPLDKGWLGQVTSSDGSTFESYQKITLINNSGLQSPFIEVSQSINNNSNCFIKCSLMGNGIRYSNFNGSSSGSYWVGGKPVTPPFEPPLVYAFVDLFLIFRTYMDGTTSPNKINEKRIANKFTLSSSNPIVINSLTNPTDEVIVKLNNGVLSVELYTETTATLFDISLSISLVGGRS